VVAGRSVCRLSTIRSVDGGTGSAQPPPLCAESPQLYRESDHRFDAPAKPVGRQQIPHFATPPSATSGFEDMILLRTGGLAASPPVRYTLETADQCLTAAVALRGAVRGRLRRGGGPPGRPVREACNERCQSRGPDASGEVVSLVRPLRADYYRFRSVSDRHAAWSEQYLRVGLSGLEPLTSALSGEFMGVAQPPVTRRGRPGRSGLIHGAVGPLSSRTTSRQPVVTIERTVSVHPLSRSSHRRPATFDAPR
jgi:hypothetical protein